MKKLFTIIGVFAFVLAAAAQQDLWPRHRETSFINAMSLIVSNNINVTNISVVGTTNVAGTVYTNKAGVRVITSATSGTNYNLLGSAQLWGRGDGSPAANQALTNVIGYIPGDAAISYSLVGGAAANSAVLFVFSPSWDGTNVDLSGNYDFVFSVTATTTTQIQSATNAPTYKWIGAKSLVCRSIGTADTDAASQVVIKSLTLNGFGPP